ncbi:hypothetical protein [Urbifossiella limnaea]|uniref:Uncharacterized protein n=1 Tax=Urbifossiella limnaea TaxID=2528023 RepID=A0A517XSU0_9BACT|nr:hypothetical protein [Urbifossiella limnaea]QDU20589.1 hypothetical protein ETAA1_25440 [Urbifossiella limnaea]
MDTVTTLPAKLRRLKEARLRQHVASEKDSALANVKYYARLVQQYTDALEKAEEATAEKVEKWAEALFLLKRAGFKARTTTYGLDIAIDIKEKRLADVTRVLGHLDEATMDKEVVDGEKRLVRVSISPARYKFVTVRYVRKLKDGDQCRIVTTEVPARVEFALVCDR